MKKVCGREGTLMAQRDQSKTLLAFTTTVIAYFLHFFLFSHIECLLLFGKELPYFN